MPDTFSANDWLATYADVLFAYLTTTGRVSGDPHRIEIWFGVADGRMYLMSGGRDRSDWVKNLIADSRVTVELGNETHAGIARVIDPASDEDGMVRRLLVEKYQKGAELAEWGRNSLPIAIAFD